MYSILDIPEEIVDYISTLCDPAEFVLLAATCRRYHSLLSAPTHIVWRHAFLQRFDDPRRCVSRTGQPIAVDQAGFYWKGELQRRIRAQLVIQNPALLRDGELAGILHTLTSMAINTPVATTAYTDEEVSLNLSWLARQKDLGEFLEHIHHEELTRQEQQLADHLHVIFGQTQADYMSPRLVYSRGFVYDLRNHSSSNAWGPYLPFSKSSSSSKLLDGSGIDVRVNWQHIRAVQHIVSMHVTGSVLSPGTVDYRRITPLSLPFCQGQISPELSAASVADDWAGVEGTWRCSFCFIDHRDLLGMHHYPYYLCYGC